MRRGFVYLVAMLDWLSRKVLSWRISHTLTIDFCLDAVREAIYRYGTPEFTTPTWAANSPATTSPEHSINISVHGKGCWHDKVFVEPLWRSVKY